MSLVTMVTWSADVFINVLLWLQFAIACLFIDILPIMHQDQEAGSDLMTGFVSVGVAGCCCLDLVSLSSSAVASLVTAALSVG